MDVVLREKAGVVVLECPSEFDIDAGASLRAHVQATVEAGGRLIVADLTETGFIGSAGIAVLVSECQRLRKIDGYLVLAASGFVANTVKVVGVDRVVDVFDDVDVAIQHLRVWSAPPDDEEE